jgi:signal transduction histidine kinase
MEPATAEPVLRSSRWRAWSPASSARIRIFAVYVLLLAVGLACAIVFGRQEMLAHVNHRIDAELSERVADLHGVAATGVDPATGRHLIGVADLLHAGIAQSTPEQNATVIALLDGRPYARLAGAVPYRIDTDPRLIAQWAQTTRSSIGSASTPAGALRYAAIPVTAPGDKQRGVFVAAIFAGRERAVVGDVTGVLVRTAGTVLIVALVVGWVTAGRVLAPVRQVTDLARSITDTDIRQRIPVHGTDEVSRLAVTFNAMLDRLEQAFALQRNLLDDAGHELRTPITIIRGHLELMGDDPAERKETVALVTDELDRMSRMVDDLLTLAKAAQPTFLRLDVVDLRQLLSDVHAKVEALGLRNWQLEQPPAAIVVLDRQRITQALVQLATNAVQHTGEGDRITLGAQLDRASDTITFTVADTGPGIPFAEQQAIFQRFHRGASDRENSQGAGLGLAIVRTIAEAHHGRVEVSSVPGHGAEFRLIVPIDVENVREESL